jgi:hypothetical protein
MRALSFKTVTAASIVLLIAAAVLGAQSSAAVNQLDPGVTVDFDINERFKLMLYTGREKSEEIGSSKWKVGGGLSVRLKPLFKLRILDQLDADKQHVLVVAALYEHSRASDAGSTKLENKIMLDATFRWAFPHKFMLSDRNRSEFRWINGDGHYRYRNRAMFERMVKAGRRTLTPYGSAEAIWDSRYRKWSIFKFTAGVEIPLIWQMSLDPYYEREHCVTCSDSQTNIYGLNLHMYFSRKK